MKANKVLNGEELTISVEGRIDTLSSKDFQKEINDELGKFNSLIIDFNQLEYISSAGLRVLIATQKNLTKNDIPMIIKNCNDNVSEIFRMSGFDKILKIQ